MLCRIVALHSLYLSLTPLMLHTAHLFADLLSLMSTVYLTHDICMNLSSLDLILSIYHQQVIPFISVASTDFG